MILRPNERAKMMGLALIGAIALILISWDDVGRYLGWWG